MPRLVWDKKKILVAIDRFITENGRFPTTKEMDSRVDLPSRSVFPKHLGQSYSEWRRNRDGEYSFLDNKFRNMNDYELKEWLKNRLIEMGTTYIYEYDKLRKQHEPSATFWKFRFNWSELMVELGLREVTYYSKDEAIKKFDEIYNEIGYTPSSPQLIEMDKKLFYSILNHFEKYNDFLRFMNVEIVQDYDYVNKTDDELVNDYLDLCNDLGKLASVREINECEWMVSSDTYVQRFGSIHKVRELAGLDLGFIGKRFYSREMLDEKVKRIVESYGKDISAKEFYFRIGCARGTVVKYYGTASVRKIIDEVLNKEGN